MVKLLPKLKTMVVRFRKFK